MEYYANKAPRLFFNPNSGSLASAHSKDKVICACGRGTFKQLYPGRCSHFAAPTKAPTKAPTRTPTKTPTKAPTGNPTSTTISGQTWCKGDYKGFPRPYRYVAFTYKTNHECKAICKQYNDQGYKWLDLKPERRQRFRDGEPCLSVTNYQSVNGFTCYILQVDSPGRSKGKCYDCRGQRLRGANVDRSKPCTYYGKANEPQHHLLYKRAGELAVSSEQESHSNEEELAVTSTPTGEGESLEQFLERHAAAGGIAVPISEAAYFKRPKHEVTNPDRAAADLMQQLERTPKSGSKDPTLKKQIGAMMQIAQIRDQIVNNIERNRIKNVHAVHFMLNAIGSAGADGHTVAITQLIQLAGNKEIDTITRQRSLIALLRPTCYNHDHAIQELANLAKDPQSVEEIMALHVRYGLIAHAAHCAHRAYGNADKYQELLQQARDNLSDAVASRHGLKAQMWLEAIGNSRSEHPEDTHTVATLALQEQLPVVLRSHAIKTLGRLYTEQARVQLLQLATEHPNEVLRTHARNALKGEMLERGDKRRHSTNQELVLLQSQDDGSKLRRQDNKFQGNRRRKNGSASFSIKYEKVWPTPSTGDLRAEPKVGAEVYHDDSVCLHGYAGVDGKAWNWVISLFQVGIQKCSGEEGYTYIGLLGVVIWRKPNQQGSALQSMQPNIQQFNQAGDTQGKCSFNVDVADFLVEVAFGDFVFLGVEKWFMIGPFAFKASVELTGEVGIKAGYSSIGPPNVKPSEASVDQACSSGNMAFGIPYIKAELVAEVRVWLVIVEAGLGLSVILVQFSLPWTLEKLTGDPSVGGIECGGVYFKIESLGGRIYGFIDDALLGRGRLLEATFYEWASPAVWTSNELKCDPDTYSTPDSSINYMNGTWMHVGGCQQAAGSTNCSDIGSL